MNVAAKIIAERNDHPDRFCSYRGCLYRTTHRDGRITPCPKHRSSPELTIRHVNMGEVVAEVQVRRNLHKMITEIDRLAYDRGLEEVFSPAYELIAEKSDRAITYLESQCALVLARLDGEREECERLRAENASLLARLAGHHEESR